MSPTKYGEGKTTMSIGLTDGLNYIGVKAIGVLREPSWTSFGLKVEQLVVVMLKLFRWKI